MVSLIAVSIAAVVLTLIVQYRNVASGIEATVKKQSYTEAEQSARGIYSMCASTEQRNQERLAHDMKVARRLLSKSGGIRLSAETVAWQAVNQKTEETRSLALPKVLLGNDWLGQVFETNKPAQFVDETKEATRDYCTVFQRINDEGDMLRVSTSVVNDKGSRAIGTYIPARLPDGSENPVIRAVLRGEAYRGRARVLNDWHAAAYEPLYDADNKRVIGMLYVGVSMQAMNRQIVDGISKVSIGKSGYICVLGMQDSDRGRYLVSHDDARDGQVVLDTKSADGRAVIQEMLAKAASTSGGTIQFESYPWKDNASAPVRNKFSAVTQFEPWGWAICATAYEDDYQEAAKEMGAAQQHMIVWVLIVAGCALAVSALIGGWLAMGIAKPLTGAISSIDEISSHVSSMSSQLSAAGKTLAEGANSQAASLEQTSASLEEVASMTARNADNARDAKQLSDQTRVAADAGSADMAAMSNAMKDIEAAANNIAKIIKTIDDIAFQTNILSLNAAVEAARAGEAGMGFAVVAQEVRNLAQRSATAAHETAAMIEDSIQKSHNGIEISGKVALSLSTMVDHARKVNDLLGEITAASQEQSQGIHQVNGAVCEMEKVTQSNASSSEEMAASTVELNREAEALRRTVADLSVVVGQSSESKKLKRASAGFRYSARNVALAGAPEATV